MLQVSFSEHDLLESTTFITNGSDSFDVTISSESESLCFEFKFEYNDTKESIIRWEAISDKKLKVSLENWDSDFGTSAANLVKVGTFAKRELFININVQRIGDEGPIRLATFSAYLGKEVEDGKD